MMKIIPAGEAKNNFGVLMDLVQKETVAISKKGRTATIVMPVDEYEIYKELKLEKLRQLVDKGSQQIKRGESTIVKNEKELDKFFDNL